MTPADIFLYIPIPLFERKGAKYSLIVGKSEKRKKATKCPREYISTSLHNDYSTESPWREVSVL